MPHVWCPTRREESLDWLAGWSITLQRQRHQATRCDRFKLAGFSTVLCFGRHPAAPARRVDNGVDPATGESSVRPPITSSSAQTLPVRRGRVGIDYLIIQSDGARQRLPALIPPRLPTNIEQR
jgi:hypothetical protein